MDFSQVTKFMIPDPSPIEGYTKLDYIQATGSQYIDTGFYPKPTTCIEMDHEFTDLTVQQRLWGCIGDLYYQSYINGSGRYAYAYQNSSGNWVNTAQTVRTERHVAKLDGKNSVYQLDGIYSIALSGSPTNTATNPLWLTAYDNAGTPTNLASIKIYSCKIWDNGTLVRDYIPVKNNNNIAGLYDLVNEEFVHSASGTEYAAGNALYETEVTKLEIEGSTMWEKAARTLSSIAALNPTTSFNRGATWSFGGAVLASFSDGSKAYVTTSATFSGNSTSSSGSKTVTVSYTYSGVTKTTTYSMTVNKAWSTLWSGSKTCKCTGTTVSGNSSNFASSASNTGYTPQIRVTFSMSASGSGSTYSNLNGTVASGTKSSPQTMTVGSIGNFRVIVAVGRGTSTSNWAYYCSSELQATKDTTNNRIRFSLYADYYTGTTGNSSLTVTKIEQYY